MSTYVIYYIALDLLFNSRYVDPVIGSVSFSSTVIPSHKLYLRSLLVASVPLSSLL
jgi:hypothetical protein